MLVSNPFNTAYDLDRASRSWWVLLVNGIVTVVAGGIILFTDWKLSDLAVFVGALLVFRGLFDMFSVPVDGSGRGWTLVSGLLEFGLGVLVWAWPAPTLLVIAFWIGWYVLFSGIMTISGAVAGRNVIPYWGFMLALGIGEVLLSFWLLGSAGHHARRRSACDRTVGSHRRCHADHRCDRHQAAAGPGLEDGPRPERHAP